MSSDSASGPSQVTRIALLASGHGSNARKILELAARHPHRLKVVAIISDRTDCPLIAKDFDTDAQKFFIPYPEKKELLGQQERRARFDQMLRQALVQINCQWLVLAGFMRILGPEVLKSFFDSTLNRHRIINLHPSILPSFRGINAMARSFAADSATGTSIHYVDDKLDHGPIILQLPVRTLPRAGEELFIKRVKRSEHLGLCKVVLELAYFGLPRGENRELAAL